MKLVQQVTDEDLAGGVPLEIDLKKFKAGDFARFRGDKEKPIFGPTLKVLGYATNPRTGLEQVVVCWFDHDNRLNEAALSEDLLVSA